MAKQTRAERKKQNQRYVEAKAAAQKAEKANPKDSEKEAELAVEAEKAAEAEKVSAEPAEEAVEAEPDAKAQKAAAREAKEQAKREERVKKAEAKAEAKKKKKKNRRGPKFIWKIVDYFKSVKVEMKRVTWPSKNEVGKMSLVVIVALVFFGVLIFAVDSLIVPLLDLYSSLGG